MHRSDIVHMNIQFIVVIKKNKNKSTFTVPLLFVSNSILSTDTQTSQLSDTHGADSALHVSRPSTDILDQV